MGESNQESIRELARQQKNSSHWEAAAARRCAGEWCTDARLIHCRDPAVQQLPVARRRSRSCARRSRPGRRGTSTWKYFRTSFSLVGRSSRVIGGPIRSWYRGFCERFDADDCPDYPRLAHYAPLRIFSIRRGHQPSARNALTGDRLLRRDLVGEKLDVVSRIDQSLARSVVWDQRRIHSDWWVRARRYGIG